MSQVLPALRIQDRSMVLRTVKLLGRVLDAEGRSVRSVPLLAETGDGHTKVGLGSAVTAPASR